MNGRKEEEVENVVNVVKGRGGDHVVYVEDGARIGVALVSPIV